MAEELSNFGSSTLLLAITDTAPGFATLVSGGGAQFPAVGDFRIRIDNELILCSGRTGDVIAMDERGIEDLGDNPATTHAADTAVYQVVTLEGLTTFIEEHTLDGNTGADGAAGKEHVIFTQIGATQLSTGSKPFPLPYDADVLFTVPFCGTPPTVDPIEMDLKVNNVSITTDKPTIPLTQYTGAVITPDDDPYEGNAGDLLTADVISVGTPSEGGQVTLDVRSVSTAVSSLSTTKSNYNIPIPTYQVGDGLINIVVTLAQSVASFPPGWDEFASFVEETSHPNSLHLYTIAKIAETVESAVQNVTFTGGTPMQSITLAVKNPVVFSNQPDDLDSVEVGVAGDAATLPPITSSLDNGLGIWIYATRYFDGIQDTPSLDPALTLDYADTTTRATQTNCGLAVGHLQFPAAGTSSAYESTVDAAIFARWVGRNLMLFQGNTGGTPGSDASLDVWFRERI